MIHTSSPRQMARRSVLVAGALAGTVAIALGITSASATAAPDTCTVNSVPVAGAVVTGSAGNDTIDCANAARCQDDPWPRRKRHDHRLIVRR